MSTAQTSSDKSEPVGTQSAGIVLFDGSCGLCDHAVQFILARDPARRFRFAPLQSNLAKDLMQKNGIDPDQTSTIVLIQGDQAYTKSTAALKIVLELREPWPLLGIFAFLPIGMRDQMYDFVARHRYQWFPKRDECRLPTPQEREQFLA
jgi:predicted DCC family thiol-disulfide oxidoreductase YuxK